MEKKLVKLNGEDGRNEEEKLLSELVAYS